MIGVLELLLRRSGLISNVVLGARQLTTKHAEDALLILGALTSPAAGTHCGRVLGNVLLWLNRNSGSDTDLGVKAGLERLRTAHEMIRLGDGSEAEAVTTDTVAEWSSGTVRGATTITVVVAIQHARVLASRKRARPHRPRWLWVWGRVTWPLGVRVPVHVG